MRPLGLITFRFERIIQQSIKIAFFSNKFHINVIVIGQVNIRDEKTGSRECFKKGET
jgi:hypothetical protein